MSLLRSSVTVAFVPLSVRVSSADVASSSSTSGGFLSRHRAMATLSQSKQHSRVTDMPPGDYYRAMNEQRLTYLCFSPPLSLSPRSPTTVSYLRGSDSMNARNCAACPIDMYMKMSELDHTHSAERRHRGPIHAIYRVVLSHHNHKCVSRRVLTSTAASTSSMVASNRPYLMLCRIVSLNRHVSCTQTTRSSQLQSHGVAQATGCVEAIANSQTPA